MLPTEIVNECNLKQNFRGQQIFENIAKGVANISELTNLSIKERERLSEKFAVRETVVEDKLIDPDGTVKLVINLNDGNKVETVLLEDKSKRKTACLSSQAGCPLACSFCKTGQLGFSRNLDASEIVEQFFYLEQSVGKLDNIVFMGMGEPLLNLNELKKAIAILSHPKGRNFSKRRITVSTAGVIKGIYELTDTLPEIKLAVSLTTADQDLRAKLMPVEKNNPLNELKTAIKYYNQKTKKRVTLEVALMHNVNSSFKSAKKIIDFTDSLNVHINLIPWNPIPELNFKSPTHSELLNFEKYLTDAGLNVTKRLSRGQKIGGACGQLGKTNISQDS
ncbi:MAG: 23S rRNA (adenine(2503)-C(2))-methyltransferase RlmN [Treponema sp.]|nr:MAG: 23S rRNA (adenine(2503)-C(2))-methyltransferase RlmN [Treponema sp.]